MTWVIEISISKQLFCISKWVVLISLIVILIVGNRAKMQVGAIMQRHQDVDYNKVLPPGVRFDTLRFLIKKQRFGKYLAMCA